MQLCTRRAARAAAGLMPLMYLCFATVAAAQQCESPDSVAEEIRQLRQEVQAMREQLDALQRAHSQAAEEQELLQAKVEDQEQTKVESGSKHHVRLSGLALLNLVGTRGAVDNLDLPFTALPVPAGQTNGSIGFDVRQSFLSLDVFGPTLGGGRTSGGVSFDFFGGFPAAADGVSAPLARLRTASFRMDWDATSIAIGQDVPFFSPRSPTSLASTAYPALSSAGNLWAWTPQVRLEHRFAIVNRQSMTIQFGILDPFSGEPPASEYLRLPTAGERSGIPAQAARIGWQSSHDERHAVLGAGAYHASHDWGFGRTVDAWAATADWDVPLGRGFSLSGELYRGQAIGGLGAGASDSVLFTGPPGDPASAVLPVNTAGGWSQLKFKPSAQLEFNTAFGEDNPFRGRLKPFVAPGGADVLFVNRNASAFVNAIFQARSNLLFAIEYRRLWTTGLDDTTHTADHISVSTGIGF
jgi:hypothetical protein